MSNDYDALDDALSDMEWTINQARAALQRAEAMYPLIPWWRPVHRLRLRRAIRELREIVGVTPPARGRP